jgi:hypothetical protein
MACAAGAVFSERALSCHPNTSSDAAPIPLPVLRLIAVLSVTASCREPAAAPAGPSVIPESLAVRSDVPYVTGTIAERRSDRALAPRILVVAGGASRVDRATVTVHPDSLRVWRDGRKATPADLTVGRSVVVWANGPELRSSPVQVTGSAILIER